MPWRVHELDTAPIPRMSPTATYGMKGTVIVAIFVGLCFFVGDLAAAFSFSRPPLLMYPNSNRQSRLFSSDTHVNGVENKKSSLADGIVLTPYQVLHPAFFSPQANGFDRKLPFYASLEWILKALERIASSNDDFLLSELLPSEQEARVIRLEHAISHPVDPLCWLHAQQQRKHDVTTCYFCNAEQELETAVYGSAHTFYKNDETLWKFVSKLPDKSHLYGGERFDSGTSSSEEWREFGSAIYILPAVELRVESSSGREQQERNNETTTIPGSFVQITLAIHLFQQDGQSWQSAAQDMLDILKGLSDKCSPKVPTMTLPPVLSRETSCNGIDGQEVYERGVTRALDAFQGQQMEKVVLARRMDLTFSPLANLNGLDIMRRWKFGGHEGGHLLYLCPVNENDEYDTDFEQKEFFGCTPERLFRIRNGVVQSEALAGTRPRGSTAQADAALMRELFESPKDRQENSITAKYIRQGFVDLEGLLKTSHGLDGFFVRRLRHLQHICQRIEATLTPETRPVEVTQGLLERLHPTPAVCGYPRNVAMEFIQEHESIGFDRGFYAGPFGYLGKKSADIVVAIRSGLLSKKTNASTVVSVYAGAGIVPGSSVQGEWAETSYKLDVISSLFLPSPITLKSAPTPNVAWTTAFVEELIRSGVTQFYICPGSRSTPLVAAVAKAVRSNVGIVHALSVHDERAAGFRALGCGRGTGRPAAVITSSGTAVGNLYPSVMEAGMDGVPMLILTADRPYENRDTGANQALDQVKAFSSTYVRWFRDIPPPSDDVPVSVALSDADQAVNLSHKLRGPVHVNIQFRENLAPEGGPIRNDNRSDSITEFNGFRFTDVPGFRRWSVGGGRWLKSYSASDGMHMSTSSILDGGSEFASSVAELSDLITKSKRGLIVVGNVRTTLEEEESETSDVLSNFAQTIGFPIMAGIQSGSLRRRSPAVIPFAEHLLKHPTVSQNMKPDLVIQIGAPLVSTEIQNMIVSSMRDGEQGGDDTLAVACSHVLLHPHYEHERTDPNFTLSHQISAEIAPFLKATIRRLEQTGVSTSLGSDLSPLVSLGRKLRDKMPEIINEASRKVVSGLNINEIASTTSSVVVDGESFFDVDGDVGTNQQRIGESIKSPTLTEPQVVLVLAESMQGQDYPMSLFLSNSMPVRTAEFFLYPLADLEITENGTKRKTHASSDMCRVGVNRGASGIDGIISTASGFAEASDLPTTLLIGDLAALHDINALHTLSSGKASLQNSFRRTPKLTTVVVNNDGGGIFSFLPIAKHGNDVSFDEFFGTPTSSFSFEEGVEAFGLPYKQAVDYDTFSASYKEALQCEQPSILEAQVVSREANVAVFQEITKLVVEYLETQMGDLLPEETPEHVMLPMKIFRKDDTSDYACDEGQASKLLEIGQKEEKVLLLLHGWMGDKAEWENVGSQLSQSIPSDWTVISLDLPGHGNAPFDRSLQQHIVLSALGNPPTGRSVDVSSENEGNFSIDKMALSVLFSLSHHYNLKSIDAIAGYSLGGRVALAMRRLSLLHENIPKLINEDTKMVLLGSHPGSLRSSPNAWSGIEPARSDSSRMKKDDALARSIEKIFNRASLLSSSSSERYLLWSGFLERWYGVSSLWGTLQKDHPLRYRKIVAKRVRALSSRGRDLAAVLKEGSPSRNSKTDWQLVEPQRTLFVAGSSDTKYSGLGRLWSSGDDGINYVEVANAGHALLVEAPMEVANILSDFIMSDEAVSPVTPYFDARKLKRPTEGQPSIFYGKREGEPDNGFVTTDRETNASEELSASSAAKMEEVTLYGNVGSLDFEAFQIDLTNGKQDGVFGIGWGEQARLSEENRIEKRSGFILNLVSIDGSSVGIGETSPLSGLHPESFDESETQLRLIKSRLEQLRPDKIPKFDAKQLLAMKGALEQYMDSLLVALDFNVVATSVKSGMEMALLSLASQVVRTPLLQAITENASEQESVQTLHSLPLNGLIMRGRSKATSSAQPGGFKEQQVQYESLKVKVGHQSVKEDALALSAAMQEMKWKKRGKLRADANRAWSMDDARAFTAALDRLEVGNEADLEFVEEPLKKHLGEHGDWSFTAQTKQLEGWYKVAGIRYALDETLADLANQTGYSFDKMEEEIQNTFSGDDDHGCAAFVLKPALLGLELSFRLARMAHLDLGIGAVFSSSFDSGVGLAYAGFLGAAADAAVIDKLNRYAHGLGTFTILGADTLAPPFASYVDDQGVLNVASLSRALYGLGLDEIRESFVMGLPEDNLVVTPSAQDQTEDFQSSAETSGSGREISVVVSLSLPFSDDVASSRFTDLPQMSRWSPWLKSVAYLDGRETEWTLNVRGVEFSWRAVSSILTTPHRGIMWESVSGLKNMGVAEFIPTSEDSCTMKVKMTIVTPRILAALFRGTSVFIEDFLQNKILKWSLEMFRDVVKGDLALERGDVELGDALFGAVEGRANAIEASLAGDKDIPTEG